MRPSWVSVSPPLIVCFCGGGVWVLCFRDTCRLMIRKIQFAPETNKAGPKAEINKQFIMSDKPIHLEASLEKEVGKTSEDTWKLSVKCWLNKSFFFLVFRSITTGNPSLLT